jgi:type II secretory pathway pseudopilin PulG
MDGRDLARARDIQPINRLLQGETGFALPTTLLMLLAVFAVVSVGVASTITVQRGSVRDQGSKAALQLAQTGVEQAVLQYNKVGPSDTNPCAPVSASGPAANGWCAPAGPFTEPGGGTFTYQVHPYDVLVNGATNKKVIEVVATGQQGNASRRVLARAESPAQNFFADASVKTSTGIILDSNSVIHSITSTNGDIVVGPNARQCGSATVGIGRQLQLSGSYFSDTGCANPTTTVGQQELVLPAVNQGDAATNNDNNRLFSQDVISGNKGDACFNGRDGNGQTDNRCGARQLYVTNNSAVTLSGGTYSFCSLTMRSNSSLYIAAGHITAIYFDSPENCGFSGTGTVTQLDLDSNTRITSATGTPSNLAMLFVGSTSRSTQLLLSSNTAVGTTCQQNYVLYAPLSHVEMNSNSTYCGALGAQSLHLDSNADIRPAANAVDLQLPPVSPHYSNPEFVECNIATGATPSSGC